LIFQCVVFLFLGEFVFSTPLAGTKEFLRRERQILARRRDMFAAKGPKRQDLQEELLEYLPPRTAKTEIEQEIEEDRSSLASGNRD
jgi:hypothetical protein